MEKIGLCWGCKLNCLRVPHRLYANKYSSQTCSSTVSQWVHQRRIRHSKHTGACVWEQTVSNYRLCFKATSFPQNISSGTGLFTYTIVEAPKYGMLTRLLVTNNSDSSNTLRPRRQRRIGVSSNFTQEVIFCEEIFPLKLFTYHLRITSSTSTSI